MSQRTNPNLQDLPELLARLEMPPVLRVCLRTFDDLAKRPGAFPPPVRIGRRKFWAKSDVINWLANGGSAQATAGSATK